MNIKEKAGIQKSILYLFIITIFMCIPITRNGSATLADILFLVIFIFSGQQSLNNSIIRRIFLTSSFLFLWMIISGIATNSLSINVYLFFSIQAFLSLHALYWLHSSVGISPTYLVFSYGLGMVLLRANNNGLGISSFKYDLFFPISIFLLMYLHQRGYPRVSSFNFGTLILIYGLIFDFRAAIFSGTLYLATYFVLRKKRENYKSISIMVLVGLVLSASILFPFVSKSGLIGERSQRNQTIIDNQGSSNYYLFFYRPEFIYGLRLSLEKPILGHGTYGEINSMSQTKALEFLARTIPLSNSVKLWVTNSSPSQLKDSGNLVFTSGYYIHSRLVSYLLYGGFLTFIFWWISLKLSFSTLIRAIKSGTRNASGLVFLNFWLFWETFFSPLTDLTRFEFSVMLFSIFVISGESNWKMKKVLEINK